MRRPAMLAMPKRLAKLINFENKLIL